MADPATVSGESASNKATGKLGRLDAKTTTRKPGDLPAQSPNRWAGAPHGAAFRSGDIVSDAEAVRNFPTTFNVYEMRRAA